MKLLNDYLRETFGCKVYKIALNAGFTCPNRDGTLGTGGCIFCSAGGSGEFAEDAGKSITEQIDTGKARVARKIRDGKYIAYFQAYTNTYAPAEHLRNLYMEAAGHPDIVAISIATRPDCLPEEVLELLTEINRIKPVWVELGLQTMHDRTAAGLNRGYALPVFEEAVRNLKSVGIEVIVHVIFGLPGETKDDMLQTIRYLSGMVPAVDGIKIQMLNILKGTAMGERYEREPFPLLSLEEYTDLVVESLRILPEQMVVHRMTGDGPGQLLIAPDWVRNKKKVLNTIQRKLRERTAGVRK